MPPGILLDRLDNATSGGGVPPGWCIRPSRKIIRVRSILYASIVLCGGRSSSGVGAEAEVLTPWALRIFPWGVDIPVAAVLLLGLPQRFVPPFISTSGSVPRSCQPLCQVVQNIFPPTGLFPTPPSYLLSRAAYALSSRRSAIYALFSAALISTFSHIYH